MSRELLALTVLQPFASAIARFGKDVENRTWLPGARLPVGGWLAIHAGMRDYPGANLDAFQVWFAFAAGSHLSADDADVAYEAIQVAGAWRDRIVSDRCRSSLPHAEIVAVAQVAAFSDPAAKASPWAVPGQEQWRFGRVFALPEPVPCKGAQGLWRVPDDVAARVRAQWTPFALAPEAP